MSSTIKENFYSPFDKGLDNYLKLLLFASFLSITIYTEVVYHLLIQSKQFVKGSEV